MATEVLLPRVSSFRKWVCLLHSGSPSFLCSTIGFWAGMSGSERSEANVVFLFLGMVCLLAAPVISGSQRNSETNSVKAQLKLNAELLFQINLHAFLLWASVGFLMPVGILLIRISNKVNYCKRALFYSHVILQIMAVLLFAVAVGLSIKNFDNFFINTHRRLGLALYALIWVHPFIGFLRPQRGVKLRSLWYTAHYLLGTTFTVAGIVNIYLGLEAYEKKTSRSLKLWTILFTIQVLIFAFIYLLQDKCYYIKSQGTILGKAQLAPSDHIATSGGHINEDKGGRLDPSEANIQ
ncbi:hypothetical protein HPP92_024298 [Vanilla planifolia]|uniref:Cytochrome b561 domain-containing protein n=1 Tax=Vanilla planifolia TaxID=51239 RepID=A0A835PQ15_VANPL|nr:hypothetical protein HPP92_024298 [Vanilla planifolia]